MADKEAVLIYGMTDNPGGMETYIKGLVGFLLSEGFEVGLLTDFQIIVYGDYFKENDVEIFHIPSKKRHPISHATAIRKILRKNPKYRFVYMNVMDAGTAYTAFFLRRKNNRILVHSHNSLTEKQQLHRFMKPFLNRMADVKLACSVKAAKYMFDTINGVEIIHNAIDVNKFRFNKQKRQSYRDQFHIEDRYVICHVGRLSPQKNPFAVVDIFKTLHERDDKAILLYIGIGELKDQILEYCCKLDIAEEIMFLEGRTDIDCILCASDAFILPSLYEGLPYSAIEAQISGLRTFISDNIDKEVVIEEEKLTFLPTPHKDQTDYHAVIKIWADSLYKANIAEYDREINLIKVSERGYNLDCTDKNFGLLRKYLV